MEYIEVKGTPFEQGLQHGQQLAPLVHKSLEFYRRFSKGKEEKARAATLVIEKSLRAHFPELVEEMKGIAEGAKVDYIDILSLNAILDAVAEGFHQCTGIGLPKTSQGPVVGKSNDMFFEEGKLYTAFRVEPRQGHSYLHCAPAGTFWSWDGINDAGLACAETGLLPHLSIWRPGTYSQLLLKVILERCGTVDEAMAFLNAHPPIFWGGTITLADSTWDGVIVVEDLPLGHSACWSEEVPTVRTNHPHCPEIAAMAADEEETDAVGYPGLYENSRDRYANARRLVDEITPSIKGLKTIFSDHTHPGAICQHGEALLHTASAIILVPRRRIMIQTEGYGCGPWITRTL